MDYFEEENKITRRVFDLESAIAFQKEHDVQIIRGEDWQYECWIDKRCYAIGLTMLGALVFGIKQYNSPTLRQQQEGLQA